MKRKAKILILTMALAALALIFALNVYAMPAAPGSGKTGADARCRSHSGELITLEDIPGTMGTPGGKGAPALSPATKDIPLAVIVIGYTNMPYDNGFDWANEIFKGEKSLQAYYSDMSFGKFTFTPVQESAAYNVGGNTNTRDAANDGVIHVSLQLPHKDWSSTPRPLQYNAVQTEMLEMFKAAIRASNEYIDYSAYDANGDGAISKNELAIAFVAAGYEGSYTDDNPPHELAEYLWAHAWSITLANDEMGTSISLPMADGVTLDDYIAIAEKLDEGDQEPISVLAHELGHYLGLPDLYDTDYNLSAEWSGYDVGALSVMCSGGWGTDPDGGFIPYSMDAWCRSILGWYTPQTAGGIADYTISSQSYTANDAFSALIVPTQHVGEYYLLENRQNTKWDAGLAIEEYADAPLANGLILWHIDDNAYDLYNDLNIVNNPDHRPTVMPLFPEGQSGSYSFIGKTNPVYTGRVFFDAAVWQQNCANLGEKLDLPLYGEGANVNKRASRSLSGVTVTFLSDSAPQMRVNVNVSGHNHRLSQVAEKSPTCTEPGRAVYWSCNICGGLYADAAGTREVTMEQLVMDPLGHTAPNVNGRCSRCGEKLVGDDEGEGACPYCGENHNSSFFGKLIRFFHSILNFFRNLFSR